MNILFPLIIIPKIEFVIIISVLVLELFIPEIKSIFVITYFISKKCDMRTVCQPHVNGTKSLPIVFIVPTMQIKIFSTDKSCRNAN
jgi:hypothetical protein